jgi:hypothetical protein
MSLRLSIKISAYFYGQVCDVISPFEMVYGYFDNLKTTSSTKSITLNNKSIFYIY